MKKVELRTILNSKTGVKYYAGPDLISYLDGMREGRPEEVQKFIQELVVNLATSETIEGSYHSVT